MEHITSFPSDSNTFQPVIFVVSNQFHHFHGASLSNTWALSARPSMAAEANQVSSKGKASVASCLQAVYDFCPKVGSI